MQPLTADAERMRRYAESSPSVVTPLNKYVGYEAAAKIAKRALAEGVETTSELDALRLEQVNEAQGFLLSRPLDPAELEAHLLEPTRSTAQGNTRQ